MLVFLGLSVGGGHQALASTNEEMNPISRVVTSGYDKKQVLEVGNKPFFYNGIQIRVDKLRDDLNYHFSLNQVAQAYKRAKADGFTVINSQILWSDIQPDESLKPTDIAYIRSDKPSTDINEAATTIDLSNTDTHKSLLYLKFNLSQLQKKALTSGHYDGAKLRIYAKGDANSNITVYGLDRSVQWNHSLTWEQAAYQQIANDKVTKLTVSPKYDPVKDENYYDFDVTDFVNERKHGQISLVLQSDADSQLDIGGGQSFKSSENAKLNDTPALSVSRKGNYDFTYLDKIINAARRANIKLEILWFGTDTTSTSTEHRMPYYVLHDYAKCLKEKGNPDSVVFSKGDPLSPSGQYNFLMDKNDVDLQKQEGTVVKALFNHIGNNNKVNGRTNTVIGAQVANEPMVARLNGNGFGKAYPQSEPSLKARAAQSDLSDADFRSWTMWRYTNNLAASVKNSKYSVLTRVNNALPSDADLTGWNEKMRAASMTNLDAVGADPYHLGFAALYDYGHNPVPGVNNDKTVATGYARGDNLPMVMEDGVGTNEKNYSFDDTAPRFITSFAGGATHNYYDFMSGTAIPCTSMKMVNL
jgi:hypothetical protein